MPDLETPVSWAPRLIPRLPDCGTVDPKDKPHKVKKRARLACLTCRQRKVRCDITLGGAPCTNCRLDSKSCAIKPRARKWYDRVLELNDRAGSSAPPLDDQATVESPCSHDSKGQEPLSATQPTEESASSKLLDDTNEVGDNPSAAYPPDTSTTSSPAHQTWNGGKGFVRFSCYSFIHKYAFHIIPSTTRSVLEEKGCFQLPRRHVLDEFIHQYFRHVHPIVPLLNEHGFWLTYSGDTTTPGRHISLFLIQAMLFVSCPYVNLSTLHRLQISSVIQARTEFYSRAKALFDATPDGDDVAIAQGALMLTYSAPTTDDNANTYWLKTAASFARKARADQYTDMACETEEKTTLKRLWWCCVMRDRIMALGLRRPLCIELLECNSRQDILSEYDFSDEIFNSKVYNSVTKTELVHLAISLSELAGPLTDILSVLYPDNAMPHTRDSQECQEIINASSRELDYWYDRIAEKFQFSACMLGGDKMVLLFSNMLYMYYHTAKASICSFRILEFFSTSKPGREREEFLLRTQAELNECLRHVTNNLMELNERELVGYLPNTFIALSASSFIWRLLDAEITNASENRENKLQELKAYTDTRQVFQSLYESAGKFLQGIDRIVDYIKMHELFHFPHPGRGDQWLVVWNSAFSTSARQIVGRLPDDAWNGMLVERPRLYLRIAVTVEFSLARGKFPTENDFPAQLQRVQWSDTKEHYGERVFEDLSESALYGYLQQAMDGDIGTGA